LLIIFPLSYYSYIGDMRKNTTKTSNNEWDDLGINQNKMVPSLSNGVGAASPLLVVVGGITLWKRRAYGAHNLSVSCRPYECMGADRIKSGY
jgi:hypothetical protein